MTRVTMATAGIGLFVIGGAVGRYAAPARVVTVERAVTSEQDVHAAAAAVAQAARTEAQLESDATQIRIVRVYERPDGGTETTTEERTERRARRSESSEATRQDVRTVVEYRDRVEVRERIKLVEAPRQDWSAAALIGLRADRSETAYGGVVMRRLVGPVEGGVWVLREGPTWSGGLAIGARW